MKILFFPSLCLAAAISCSAQDAPAAGTTVSPSSPSQSAATAPAAASASALPNTPSSTIMVNGRPYRRPTEKDRALQLGRSTIWPGALLSTGVSSAIQFGMDRPSAWGQDFNGYLQRYGSSFGERSINATTRFALSSAFHEDTRYLICHKCSAHDKLRNAFLSEVTARHGEDGHRAFSITPIAGSIPGALVSRATWYPSSGTNTNPGVRIATGVATRVGLRIVREFLFDRDRKNGKGKLGELGSVFSRSDR